MGILIVLIGISLLVAIGFLVAFLWAVRNAQFDDDYTPSVRILFDDQTAVDRQETPDQQLIEMNHQND